MEGFITLVPKGQGAGMGLGAKNFALRAGSRMICYRGYAVNRRGIWVTTGFLVLRGVRRRATNGAQPETTGGCASYSHLEGVSGKNRLITLKQVVKRQILEVELQMS
jgi:hypothetical protein